MLLPKQGNRSGTLSRTTLPGQPEARKSRKRTHVERVCAWISERRPLDPVHPGYARWLLTHQKAAVFRRYPFTIILQERKPEVPAQPLRLKIDPGSKTTGLALVNDATGRWSGRRN